MQSLLFGVYAVFFLLLLLCHFLNNKSEPDLVTEFDVQTRVPHNGLLSAFRCVDAKFMAGVAIELASLILFEASATVVQLIRTQTKTEDGPGCF